jgi:hypothetical protein
MRHVILRGTVGSEAHGIAVGSDDHDEMAVYVEPPEQTLGVHRGWERYVWRTQPEGHRSGPGDVDLIAYSLRRYLRLAGLKANPSTLLLFVPERLLLARTPLGDDLRGMRDVFLTQDFLTRSLGYMRGQRDRMLGLRHRAGPGRLGFRLPELRRRRHSAGLPRGARRPPADRARHGRRSGSPHPLAVGTVTEPMVRALLREGMTTDEMRVWLAGGALPPHFAPPAGESDE